MKTLFCALVLVSLATASAKAAPVTDVSIIFDKPNQTAAPGATIQFFGTIVNDTSSPIFLNSDDLTVLGLSLTTADMFGNTPLSLAPNGQMGSSSGDIELFDILVSKPLLDSAGKYTGAYDLVGGIDGNAQDVLDTTAFSVTTTSTTPGSIPEPPSILLVFTALFAAFLATRRRASRAAF